MQSPVDGGDEGVETKVVLNEDDDENWEKIEKLAGTAGERGELLQ